jgi:DegV family protein with EDD domain
MPNIHIVTDSCALYAGAALDDPERVTVVPGLLHLGAQTYREGCDLTAEDAMRLMKQETFPPHVVSPTVAQFLEVYNRLIGSCDAIISIHPSRLLYPNWENARAAMRQVASYCPIEVVDSQTISAGQAMLVRLAQRVITEGLSFEEVVRKVRGASERVYSVYYVDSVDMLLQNKIVSSSHAILGAMLGIKPFLTIEEGALRMIEKVRTRTQAVERLVEYVVEFIDIEDAIILQNKPYLSDQTRMIQDRLALEFPDHHFPYAVYGPSLAALIGVDATGLVVLEREMEAFDDDF